MTSAESRHDDSGNSGTDLPDSTMNGGAPDPRLETGLFWRVLQTVEGQTVFEKPFLIAVGRGQSPTLSSKHSAGVTVIGRAETFSARTRTKTGTDRKGTR